MANAYPITEMDLFQRMLGDAAQFATSRFSGSCGLASCDDLIFSDGHGRILKQIECWAVKDEPNVLTIAAFAVASSADSPAQIIGSARFSFSAK